MSSTLASQRHNNLVAESDYQAALAAIDNYFSCEAALEEAWETDWKASLKEHLARIVQPLADEAHDTFLFQQLHPNNDEHQSHEDTTNTIDPSLLLDPVVQHKVQQLRHQVRTQAQQVQDLRTDVLSMVAHHVQQQQTVVCANNTHNDNNTTQLQHLQQVLEETHTLLNQQTPLIEQEHVALQDLVASVLQPPSKLDQAVAATVDDPKEQLRQFLGE